MLLRVADDADAPAVGSYHVAFGHALLGVVRPLGVDFGADGEQKLGDGRLVEDRDVVNGAQGRDHLGALRVFGVLFRIAPERYREVAAALGEGPRADLRARAQFWARYSGRLSSLGQSVNHAYLRVNGVKSGVRNYNEASALIVGYYLKQSAAAARPAAD